MCVAVKDGLEWLKKEVTCRDDPFLIYIIQDFIIDIYFNIFIIKLIILSIFNINISRICVCNLQMFNGDIRIKIAGICATTQMNERNIYHQY